MNTGKYGIIINILLQHTRMIMVATQWVQLFEIDGHTLSKILVKFRVLRASKNANLFPVSKNLKYSSDSLTGNGFPFEGFPAMPPHFQVPDCEAI